MILYDIHAHLTHPDFKDDLAQVLERSKKEGVKVVIANGVNPDDNREVLKLAEKFEIVKPALGFYPTESQAKKQNNGILKKNLSLSNLKKTKLLLWEKLEWISKL
jgi:Tat protein secretion system quality control protein TatD with DNase activity